jgi:hypothetical protein
VGESSFLQVERRVCEAAHKGYDFFRAARRDGKAAEGLEAGQGVQNVDHFVPHLRGWLVVLFGKPANDAAKYSPPAKEGRYGSGQILLLADQPLLLVLTDTGEVVLVAANPDRHQELGRFQAIEGKTWNHPVIAHGRLYVRNADEMACYELR